MFSTIVITASIFKSYPLNTETSIELYFHSGLIGRITLRLTYSFLNLTPGNMDNTPRIIFVGVHNKPGFAPLDSRSKSGKMIDRVIAGLQTECGLFEAEFVKTNLFDLPGFPSWSPERGVSVMNWSKRAGRTDDDIVILLGACVHDAFKHCKYPNLVRIGHPSGVWSKLKQEEYIINACIKVSEVLKPETV